MAKYVSNKWFVIIGLLLAATVSGCATILGVPKQTVESLADLADDELLYVGKIVIDPPIQRDEVIVKNVLGGGDRFHRGFMIKASDVFYNDADISPYSGLDGIYGVETGKDYYIVGKKGQPFIILGGSFYTRVAGVRTGSGGVETQSYIIADGLQVKAKPDARAVYIGTITFKRDEFFDLKGIDISQSDYSAAAEHFKEKYNTSWALEKAELTSAR